MPLWQERLFMALAASASSAANFYRLPSNRVIELGQQITL
jgi:KUP system potassium uptake protein